MVERLWVPVSQVLLARNWNAAISFCFLTASRVANSAGVSTPLRGWRAVVVVIRSPVLVGWLLVRPAGGWVGGGVLGLGRWRACWGGWGAGGRGCGRACGRRVLRCGGQAARAASTKDSVAHHCANRSSPNTAASGSVWEAWARRAAC